VTLRALRAHARILIDTSVWIYHLEQHPRFARAAGLVIAALEAGAFQGVASELTLLELTAGPLRQGRQDVADDYELLLSNFPNLALAPVTRDVLLDAAGLRAEHGLRTPEAIHIATAFRAGATAAVTNDAAWAAVPGLKTILLDESAG
jgi:predicted nucleic acid-binding protein